MSVILSRTLEQYSQSNPLSYNDTPSNIFLKAKLSSFTFEAICCSNHCYKYAKIWRRVVQILSKPTLNIILNVSENEGKYYLLYTYTYESPFPKLQGVRRTTLVLMELSVWSHMQCSEGEAYRIVMSSRRWRKHQEPITICCSLYFDEIRGKSFNTLGNITDNEGKEGLIPLLLLQSNLMEPTPKRRASYWTEN